ncbi:MAG: hypothetical protein KatS3mg005_4139 [Bryobacteraceae bacterium]|nr:MAG: hypothetical protein KatS3mg005_4139 [Bryobacteraceae bacterium]
MADLVKLLEDLKRCNHEAFMAVANLEACGPALDRGALLGLKDWLSEMRLLIAEALGEAERKKG